MGISAKDIKKLFSLSAGRCNICHCELEHIGEMAHIIAKSSNGSRGSIENKNDNSYNNLILLCANHHLEIDRNPDKYSVEYLHEIKKKHEEDISSRLVPNNKNLQEDESSLNTLFSFIPINNFIGMATELPYKVSIDFNARYMFNQFYKDNPTKYPFWDNELTNLFDDFLTKMDKLTDWTEGTININNNLITNSEMIHGSFDDSLGYNIYIYNDDGYMVINKKFLNDEQKKKIYTEVSSKARDFMNANMELINYIKKKYKNIQW